MSRNPFTNQSVVGFTFDFRVDNASMRGCSNPDNPNVKYLSMVRMIGYYFLIRLTLKNNNNCLAKE